MLFSVFLEHTKTTKTLPPGNVFCFIGQDYSLLFFSQLISFFERNTIPIQVINCQNAENTSIKTTVSTVSFTDNNIYWIKDFHVLSDKKQQELLHYFSLYTGPHTIVLFTHKKTLVENCSYGKMNVIEIPHTITSQDFTLIRFLIHDSFPLKTNFANQVGMYSDHLSLDIVCLLAHYELVLGKNSDDFFTHWITRIIDSSNSLFIVSQYFFSKKLKQFWRQWSLVIDNYPTTFWVTFWADQLWRAYIYTDLMKQKNYAEAKKNQYKLPFSFINKDWCQYDIDELSSAYQFLYEIDYKLKNGGSEGILEYFFLKFFNGQFRKH